MASEDTIAGVLARLLLDKPHQHDEHGTPHVAQLWGEHLADADDRDVVAACRAMLMDSDVRYFPTVAQFLDEVQIQGRDRLLREKPDPDAVHQVCALCGDVGYVFVENAPPWTVRPCDCNERLHDLWQRRHFRVGHMCVECSAATARSRRAPRAGRKTQPERPKVDPSVAARMMGEEF